MQSKPNVLRKYTDLAFQVQNNGALERRRAIVRELSALGVPTPRPELGRMMAAHEYILKKPGVVVIGSTAFEAYCGLKGFTHVPSSLISTSDVDIACLTPKATKEFLAPPLTAANAATRLPPHGHNATIDFVTPGTASHHEGPKGGDEEKQMVYVQRFDSYAYVIPNDRRLLVMQPVRAVILHDAGISVAVPDPTRFALHKLLLSEERAHGNKVAKDRQQAMMLLKSASEAGNKLGVMQEFAEFGGGRLVKPIHSALTKCAAECPPADIVDFFKNAALVRHSLAVKAKLQHPGF